MARAPSTYRWVRAAGVTVALTALAAVIAAAAHAPLSHSTPVDARSASTPATALFAVMIGGGIIALTALVVILWPGRRRRDEDEPEHELYRPEIHWFWKLAAMLLPLALAALLFAAAIIGGERSRTTATGSGLIGEGLADGARGRSPAPGRGFVLPRWVPWTALGLLIAAVAIAGWLLWRWWHEPVVEPSSEDASAARGAAVTAAVTALATVQDPREAIIAAYVTMEHVLAAHGIRRGAAEAPREYLRRVLMADAGDREATTLTGLFEEARFSSHLISADLRQRALAALRAIQTRLGTDRAR